MAKPSNPASNASSSSAMTVQAATRWLALAATPTFASMALLSSAEGGADMICTTAASPISGMTLMYLLMAVFHSGSWLRLAANWR